MSRETLIAAARVHRRRMYELFPDGDWEGHAEELDRETGVITEAFTSADGEYVMSRQPVWAASGPDPTSYGGPRCMRCSEEIQAGSPRWIAGGRGSLCCTCRPSGV